jgi:hypothetical protein
MPRPIFPGVPPASLDFQAVKDDRRTRPFYYDVDLSVARSIAANTALALNIAGNFFYSDPVVDAAGVQIGGTAVVHFQDQSLSAQGTPFTVVPQFIARIPFTQVLIENPAQAAGTKLRIIYGVDLDFAPGRTGAVTISNAPQVSGNLSVLQQRAANDSVITAAQALLLTRDVGFLYGASFSSAVALGVSANQAVVTPAANVSGAIVWAAGLATGAAVNKAASMLAKTSAPANTTDGDVLLFAFNSPGGNVLGPAISFERARLIAAGKGIYFQNDPTAETTGMRWALYTILP